MTTDGAARFVSEVHQEVVVELHAAVLSVHVDHHHHGAVLELTP